MCCAASDALGGQKECDLCVSTDEKIHLYLRISGVVQRDSLVGLAPGHSGSLIPCLILLSWRDLDHCSGLYRYFKGRHLFC